MFSSAPRGMSFLYNPNRLNVATSRAQCISILVATRWLLEPECRTPEQMRWANGLCRYRGVPVNESRTRSVGSKLDSTRPMDSTIPSNHLVKLLVWLRFCTLTATSMSLPSAWRIPRSRKLGRHTADKVDLGEDGAAHRTRCSFSCLEQLLLQGHASRLPLGR